MSEHRLTLVVARLRWLLLGCLVLCAVSLPQRAVADEGDEKVARLEEEAVRLYEQRQWPDAIRSWETAYQIDAQPRFLFNIGQAYRKMNLHREAVDNFQRYLQEMERPEYQRDPRNRIDPTIKIDVEAYVIQMKAVLERLSDRAAPRQAQPEPAPYLVAEEIVDAEELFDQMVKESRAGNTAVASDLVRRLEEVYRLRGDPQLLYYFARAYDQLGKKKEALEYYRRYIATDPPDSSLRRLGAAGLRRLTPPPPGQKYLWPAIVFGTLGLGGAAAGAALYVESQNNFNQFQQPLDGTAKLALRARAEQLGLGTIAAFAAGGTCAILSAVLFGVAGAKGVRQRDEAREPRRAALPAAALSLRGLAAPLPGGGVFLLQGAF